MRELHFPQKLSTGGHRPVQHLQETAKGPEAVAADIEECDSVHMGEVEDSCTAVAATAVL